MTKVHGKRYAYKFDFHGLMSACQAQNQSTSAGQESYKYQHGTELGALYQSSIPTSSTSSVPSPLFSTNSGYWMTSAGFPTLYNLHSSHTTRYSPFSGT